MTTRRFCDVCILWACVLAAVVRATAASPGTVADGFKAQRHILQKAPQMVFKSGGASPSAGLAHQHPGSPTGIIINGHEYKGALLGEVNADGSPVTFAQQQAGIEQHSQQFSHSGAPHGRRSLQQTGGFSTGTTASQSQPIVVDMTHSALEQSMLGNGPRDASINSGVNGGAGAGNIAHIDNDGAAAVVVPVPKTPAAPAKVAGGAAKRGRRLQQTGSFGSTASQTQPIVVDMTHSALEQSMLGNGPRDAGINGGVNGGAGAGNIAHIDNDGGAAVVVPVPKTPAAPAKVAGGSVAAGRKPSGRRMLQQSTTGSFSSGGPAAKSPAVPVPSTTKSPAASKLSRG